MKRFALTNKEKLMLFGMVEYPLLTDKQLSEKLGLKHSTATAIRHRLRDNEYFRTLIIPRLQNMGCTMLVVIYLNFSPLISLEERIRITESSITVFDELFLSIGEQDKGFSFSLAEDYATIGKINDIRTQAFGGRGILEDEYPNMVVFPFEISRIYRFFDFAPLLSSSFELEVETDQEARDYSVRNTEKVVFNETMKNVYYMLVKYPELSDNDIGRELGVSRHTVSRLRRNFEQENLMRRINLPNLKKLGFEILTFVHIQFNPRNPPDMERNEAIALMSDATIFMASRMFETVMLFVHSDYDAYKRERTRIMQVLKENKWVTKDPVIRTYGLNTLVFMKDFKFAPITRKIVGCTLLI
ncbi:MAG: hypothetical protein V1726_03150 [Methanobacteriota archaeon]